MTSAASPQDQRHPQEKRDCEVIKQILQGEVNDLKLAELARLRIRYQKFPGAREIQRDLDLALQRWNLTEEELFCQTRAIHTAKKVYVRGGKAQGQEDWS